jgi:hypothetical protein
MLPAFARCNHVLSSLSSLSKVNTNTESAVRVTFKQREERWRRLSGSFRTRCSVAEAETTGSLEDLNLPPENRVPVTVITGYLGSGKV